MENPEKPGAYNKDYDGLVCSAEFAAGCADPLKGAPPTLEPDAPIPPVAARPQAKKTAAAEPPAPVQTHNAAETPEAGFPEIACSPEFPEGCVGPADDATPPV